MKKKVYDILLYFYRLQLRIKFNAFSNGPNAPFNTMNYFFSVKELALNCKLWSAKKLQSQCNGVNFNYYL